MKTSCAHSNIAVINPYELIRKFKCADCGGVMMCACDEAYGRRDLPHQTSAGTRLETKERVPVTLGFVTSVCHACRGLSEPSTPMAAIHGRTSKILRYYWREIAKETSERFARWALAKGLVPSFELRGSQRTDYERIHAEVVEDTKTQHERAAKYEYSERSAEEVIKEFGVTVVALDGMYVKPAIKGQTIVSDGTIVSVEEFVSRRIEHDGFRVMKLESTPVHVLFAVFMTPLLSDHKDNFVRSAFFGQRDPSPADGNNMISADMPSDFGDTGYAVRRHAAIEKHLSKLPRTSKGLASRFEGLFAQSWPLRQYFWAHKIEDAERALELLGATPPDRIAVILRYLIEDYWGRYLGWPDLLAAKSGEFFLAEVKGSGDKLSEDQKTWIEGNSRVLRLPFRIYKVHRRNEVQRASLVPDGT